MKQLEPNKEYLFRLNTYLKKDFIQDCANADWKTVDIDYEPPRVERVFLDKERFRVCIHRIHRGDADVLYHPHPWASAIHILSGSYEMALGTENEELTRLVMCAGSQYEILTEDAWHSVSPITKEVISIMITGKPFENPKQDHKRFGKDRKFEKLTDKSKDGLLGAASTLCRERNMRQEYYLI